MTQSVVEFLKWAHGNWGNVIKTLALLTAALGFFVSLKVDIAVLKSQTGSLEFSATEVNKKVDRLYDYFFDNRLNVSDNR